MGMGFDSKHDFAPPTALQGLLLCPWTWGIFFGGIQHSPVDGCLAVSCNFGVLAGENEHTSFHSTILEQVSVNGLSCCSLHLLVPSFPKLSALIPEEWLLPGIL